MSNRSEKKFLDRHDAGIQLAEKLKQYKNNNVYVLALPRGGVPVGYQIAKKLNLPLSVLISKKIGAPGQPEFGIGAVAENNILILDKKSLTTIEVEIDDITETIDKQKAEIRRRVNKYRDNKPLPSFKGKTIILVDDGLATGVTAKAAIKSAKKLNAEKVIYAVPVCAKQSVQKIKDLVDDFVCLSIPENLRAIGLYYTNFDQVSDDEVVDYLKNEK